MKKVFGSILIVPFVIYLVIVIFKSVMFDINCGNRMGRASDANSITLAREEMEVVVKYLEDNQFTTGYTSVIYNTPDEDMGFFYKNMKSALEELISIKETASPMEKSNLLMKLRESLTHHGEKGSSITVPSGISFAPHNVAFAIWGIISLIIAAVGAIIIANDTY